MRRLTRLELEQIGDDLCIVFKSTDSRHRGILGSLEPDGLAALASGLGEAARRYAERNTTEFQATVYEI